MLLKVERHHTTPSYTYKLKADRIYARYNPVNEVLVQDSAEYIIKDLQMKKASKLIYHAMDKISPFIDKHPKIGNQIIKCGETLLRFCAHI